MPLNNRAPAAPIGKISVKRTSSTPRRAKKKAPGKRRAGARRGKKRGMSAKQRKFFGKRKR